jgi:hypothetical protein
VGGQLAEPRFALSQPTTNQAGRSNSAAAWFLHLARLPAETAPRPFRITNGQHNSSRLLQALAATAHAAGRLFCGLVPANSCSYAKLNDETQLPAPVGSIGQSAGSAIEEDGKSRGAKSLIFSKVQPHLKID